MDSAAPPRASPSILVRIETRDGYRIPERLRDGHRLLADHGIHDQQRLGRLHDLGDTPDLGHERLVDAQAAGRVEDDHVAAGALRLGDAAARDIHDGGARRRAVDRDIEGRAEGLELIDGGGSIGVGCHEQRLAALAHDVAGQLGGGGGLAGALEADQRDDRGRPVEAEGPVAGAQDRGQLVMHDLDDELAGVDALQHVLADGPFLDPPDEVLDDLVVDVRFQEGEPDLAHGGVDVGLRDPAAAGELAKDVAQAVAECIEHGTRSVAEAAVRLGGR